jgi:hypothetical protein
MNFIKNFTFDEQFVRAKVGQKIIELIKDLLNAPSVEHFGIWLNNCTAEEKHLILENKQLQYISFMYKNNTHFTYNVECVHFNSIFSPLEKRFFFKG